MSWSVGQELTGFQVFLNSFKDIYVRSPWFFSQESSNISQNPRLAKIVSTLFLAFQKKQLPWRGIPSGVSSLGTMILACEPFLSFSDDNCTEAVPRLLTDTMSGAQISDLAISAEPQSFKRLFPIYLSFSKKICCLGRGIPLAAPHSAPLLESMFLAWDQRYHKRHLRLSFNAHQQTPGLLKTLTFSILFWRQQCVQRQNGGDCWLIQWGEHKPVAWFKRCSRTRVKRIPCVP